MCDSAKCDDCGKFSRVLYPNTSGNWHRCYSCKRSKEIEERYEDVDWDDGNYDF